MRLPLAKFSSPIGQKLANGSWRILLGGRDSTKSFFLLAQAVWLRTAGCLKQLQLLFSKSASEAAVGQICPIKHFLPTTAPGHAEKHLLYVHFLPDGPELNRS